MPRKQQSKLSSSLLLDALYSARKWPDVFAALVRLIWAKWYGPDSECPERLAQWDDSDGTDWVTDCPEEAWREAADRAGGWGGRLLGTVKDSPGTGARLRSFNLLEILLLQWGPNPSPTEAVLTFPRVVKGEDGELVRVSEPIRVPSLPSKSLAACSEILHARWAERPAGQHGKHPLAPLIEVWLARQPIDPDQRPTGIVPMPFTFLTNRKARAALPDLTGRRSEGAFQVGEQMELPGLGSHEGEVPALISLLDGANAGNWRNRSGNASVFARIFTEALLSVPTAARRGVECRFSIAVSEAVGDWLAWNPKNYRARAPKTGLALEKALDRFYEARIPVGKTGWYLPLIPWGVSGFRMQDRLGFVASIPSAGTVGPLVNRVLMRQIGKLNAAAYRAYLWLSFDWNRYGSHAGQLIRPHRQHVLRDPRGRLLDRDGNLILHRSGRAARSNWHDLAVLTGKAEWNPARARYPRYSRADILRMCFTEEQLADSQRDHYASIRKLIE